MAGCKEGCDEDYAVTLTNWRKLGPCELESQRKFGMELVSVVANSEAEGKVADNGWRKYGGFIFGLLAAASFSTASLSTKLLKQRKCHTFNIALWKYQGMTLFGPILLLYFRFVRKNYIFDSILPLKEPGMKKRLFFLLCRATVGVCTMCLQTQSLQYLKLGDSSVIAYSTPIAVVIFGRIFLGEACGLVSVLVAGLTLVGVCVLTRPPLLTGAEAFDSNILIGVGFAFTSMLFLSSVFIIIRLIKDVHFSLFIFFYGYVASLETLVLALSFGVLDLPRTDAEWALAGLNALMSLLGQLFLILALKADLAGLVSLVRTGDVVFAFIWQSGLGTYPDMYSLIGASIVVSCILFTGFTKWLTTLPANHTTRRRLRFLIK